MKLLRGNSLLSQLSAGVALTIGNFDGVHRGHQALLDTLRRNARRLGLPTLVVFFEPQPVEYFQGTPSSIRLMVRREKLHWLGFYGIDYVYCLTFDQAMASMSARAFAEHYIFSFFNARFLFPVIRETFKHLKQGGTFAINISEDAFQDVRRHEPRLLPTTLHAKHRLFVQPRFAKGNPVNPDKQYKEYIYVWKKV